VIKYWSKTQLTIGLKDLVSSNK